MVVNKIWCKRFTCYFEDLREENEGSYAAARSIDEQSNPYCVETGKRKCYSLSSMSIQVVSFESQSENKRRDKFTKASRQMTDTMVSGDEEGEVYAYRPLIALFSQSLVENILAPPKEGTRVPSIGLLRR